MKISSRISFGPTERSRLRRRAASIATTLSLPALAFLVAACSSDGGGGAKPDLGAPEPVGAASLFACSPCNPYPGMYGVAGCTTQTNPGTCNDDCGSYFEAIPNGMQMTAGDSCHTVNSHDDCLFDIGDGGVTQVDFDFSVTDACHQTVDTTEWLSFWIYSEPWNSTVEADFIESLNGPGGRNGALNANFAGNGQQVIIFPNSAPSWQGHITTTFSGSGSSITATTTNSANAQVATSTLTRSSGYFFVMDTALGSGGNTACSFTITNLKIQGTVPAGQCVGLLAP